MVDGTITSRSPVPGDAGRRHGRVVWRPVLALGLVVGAGWAGLRLTERRPGAVVPPATGMVAPPPTVPVARARVGDLAIETTGLGTVQPFNTVTVKPRVGGQVTDVDFTEGQAVSVGSPLAHIDQRNFLAPLHQAQANLAKDEAQLDNVEADLGRTSNLAQRGYATGQALDTQRAQVAGLRAQILADRAVVENAQTQVDYTTVTSPIAGVAGLRMVDAGNVVSPSDPGIVVVNQIEPIAVVMTVPADAVAGWPVGVPPRTVSVSALRPGDGRELARGTLSLVDNHIDPTTGTIKLKATFPNADHALKPGQFVNGRLETEALRGVVTVPAGAVQPAPQGSFVLLVGADGRLEQRAVTVGRASAERLVVLSGLKGGEVVVTAGQYTLKPGTLVDARPSDDGPAPPPAID